MYFINLLVFSFYTGFWFYFLDNPLENFIKNTINLYKSRSIEDFIIVLRLTFLCFLFTTVVRIGRNYTSFKKFINKIVKKRTDHISMTEIEKDRYKIDFIINNEHFFILIKKSTEHQNIEGIYTDDYNDCVTNEVTPFFAFCQDIVRPHDINQIYEREDKRLIVTYKNKEERTIITDEQVYEKADIEYENYDLDKKIINQISHSFLPEIE